MPHFLHAKPFFENIKHSASSQGTFSLAHIIGHFLFHRGDELNNWIKPIKLARNIVTKLG